MCLASLGGPRTFQVQTVRVRLLPRSVLSHEVLDTLALPDRGAADFAQLLVSPASAFISPNMAVKSFQRRGQHHLCSVQDTSGGTFAAVVVNKTFLEAVHVEQGAGDLHTCRFVTDGCFVWVADQESKGGCQN